MKLVFNMESWEVCGGGIEFFGEEVLVVGNKYIDKVLEIFEEVSLQSLIERVFIIKICVVGIGYFGERSFC